MPLGRRPAASVSMSVIARAVRAAPIVTGVRARSTPVGAAISSTVPQAWHSPQRPTHLAAVQPHSVQR